MNARPSRPDARDGKPGPHSVPFDGPGEMRAHYRTIDWDRSAVGPIATWSPVLRSMIALVLDMPHPSYLLWGDDTIGWCNDAYLRATLPAIASRSSGPTDRPALATALATSLALAARTVRETGVAARLPDVRLSDEVTPSDPHADARFACTLTPVRDGLLVMGVLLTFDDIGPTVAHDATSAAQLLEHMSDEHLTMDADFRILTLNSAAQRALGITLDSVRGRSHWEVFPSSIGTPTETAYRRAMIDRREAHLSYHYVGDGYDRHLRIDVYPTNDGGLALFWRDVSEWVHAYEAVRRGNERYRSLFDSIDAGFCVIEVLFDAEDRPVDYRFIEANPAFERQSGLTHHIGRTARELVPDLEQHWFDTYGQVATTGIPTRFENGSESLGRWFDVYAFRLGDGDEHRVAVLFTDVTATKQADIERERLLADSERARSDAEQARRDAEAAREEAEAASRAKSDFLAVMSHELRTPLNAIGGYVELIQLGIRGPTTVAQRADLIRIQHSQKHLLGLINQVLNHARIESGTVQYAMSDVPIIEVLQEAEAIIRPQIHACELTYDHGDLDPSLMVHTDRDKFQQILLNVLTNAIKFTDAGGRIGLTCTADGDTVRIAIDDTGIGIPAGKLVTIFEPFVQVQTGYSRSNDGVGLGLSISRDLARGMGGELTATSTLGVGSTFTLVLPRAEHGANDMEVDS